MGNNQTRDYKKELHHRLLAAGISDGEFFETFSERHGVEDSLRKASNNGPADYEEELVTLVGMAEQDYDYYSPRWSGRVQEGDIPPKKALKKKRRARKPKDIAGAWERQEALSHYLEEAASHDEKIGRFRERALSGRLLSEEEALAFLSSPLLADQPLSTLVGNSISLLEKSHLLKEETDETGPYRDLVIEGWQPWKARPLAAKGRELVYPGDVLSWQDARGLRGVGAIFFPHPREGDRLVIARRGSVIAELFRLAEGELAGYPISGEMGVWFILTGEFIPQDPVKIRYMRYRDPEFSRTTFTLEVEGWVPPEEVIEQYRHAQHEILGGTPRSLKRKTVTLFEFVNRHKGRSWSELLGAWNEAHPGERFKDQRFRDRSHLFTTYMRALEYIAGAKPNKDKLKVAGTDSHGFPIIADKWYILRQEGYTALFDSREEAEEAAEADSSSEPYEVLTAEQLVACLAERTKNNQPSS